MKLKDIMNLVTDNECVILKKTDAIEPLLIAVALAKDIKQNATMNILKK